MELPDRELLERLARGDREALSPLMERHYRRIYRIALSYLRDADEALDCAQDTFVKAFQNAGRWDPTSAVGAWLTRIAVNDAIDRYRRRKRRNASFTPLEPTDHDASMSDHRPSPEKQVRSRELSEGIQAAVLSLPEKQRAVFCLRHYDERSLREIAEILGMNLGTVKSSLFRAIQQLREHLQGITA